MSKELVALLVAVARLRRDATVRAGRFQQAIKFQRAIVFMVLCFVACLRKSEAIALRWADIMADGPGSRHTGYDTHYPV